MAETTDQKPRGYLRDTMPECAAFIDMLRATFGADQVDPSIKAGMAGLPNKFHASEGGRTIGTPFDGETGVSSPGLVSGSPESARASSSMGRR